MRKHPTLSLFGEPSSLALGALVPRELRADQVLVHGSSPTLCLKWRVLGSELGVYVALVQTERLGHSFGTQWGKLLNGSCLLWC